MFRMAFNIYYQNVRGLRTKTEEFFNSLTMLSHTIDCIVLTETWLNETILDNEIVPSNYNLFRKDRDPIRSGKSRGGGVAVLVKSEFPSFRCQNLESQHEQLIVKIQINRNTTIALCALYIPPASNNAVYDESLGCLEKLANDYNNEVVCIGDFNLPLLGNFFLGQSVDMPGIDVRVKETLSLANLKQINTVRNANDRILDFVVTNFSGAVCMEAPEELVPRDFHHPPLLVTITVPKRTKNANDISLASPQYQWRKGDYVSLYHLLNSCDWDVVKSATDVDEAVKLFYETMEGCIRQAVPQRKPLKNKFPPWFSPSIKNGLKEKERLRKIFLRTRDPTDYQAFSDKRAEVRIAIKRAYKLYISNVEQGIAVDPKKFWSFIKQRKGGNGQEKALHYKGKVLTTNREKCDALADHFHSVYSPSAPSLNIDEITANNPISDGVDSLVIDTVSEEEVKSSLNKLKPKSSFGTDGIPQYIFKAYGELLVPPLVAIFNLSLRTCKYPTFWKTSAVCPVPKKIQVQNIEDHRPISLLCTPAKVFEGVLHARIFNHVKSSITPHQYGFVPNRSTSTNLINHLQVITDTMNDSSQLDVIYTDFAKAFDSVKFPFLLGKFRTFGFSKELLVFFASYLYGRSQYVKLNGVNSVYFSVNSGVGQGSKLGPLFFLIMINDLVKSVSSSMVFLFADDLKLSKKVESIEDAEELQKDLNAVVEWSDRNQLFFNCSKCSVMTFSLNRNPILYDYSMSGVVLNRNSILKDLGVLFDSKLTFIHHINSMVGGAFRMLGFIKRSCRYFRNSKAIIQLYNAYIRPKLEFSSIIWDPIYQNQISQIERVQKKFVRYLYTKIHKQDAYSLPYEEILAAFNMDSLSHRRKVAKETYISKLIKGKENNCFMLEKLPFSTTPSRHHATFYLPYPRINIYKRAPIYSLCSTINNNHDLDIFK